MLSAFPGRQFFLRQKVDDVVGNKDLTLKDIGLTLAQGLARDQTRDWLAPPRDDDILAGLDPRQQSRELSLGLADIDDVNGSLPLPRSIQLTVCRGVWLSRGRTVGDQTNLVLLPCVAPPGPGDTRGALQETVAAEPFSLHVRNEGQGAFAMFR